MAISSDTKERLKIALTSEAAGNEVADSIDTALSQSQADGDIKSDGSVPFAADQSMGGNKLTNVEDPAAAQDASTKNYVDLLTKAVGDKITVFVDSADGDDATGTGTVNSPFKTLEAAQNSFNDESALKPYILILSPGIYEESPSFAVKHYVDMFSYSRDNTLVYKSDFSPIDLFYGGADSYTQTFTNITFYDGMNLERQAAQTAENSLFIFDNCQMFFHFAITGSGDTGVGPFIFDVVHLVSGSYDTIEANAVNLQLRGSFTGNITYSGIGVDATTSAGLIQTITNSRTTFHTISGAIIVQLRGTSCTRVTISDATAQFNSDAIGFPGGNTLANGPVLNGGATLSQVGKTTIAPRVRNPVRTVTSSPGTINAIVDHIIKSDLTVAGPVILNLPSMVSGAASCEGYSILIIDGKGDAATNNITINAGGTDTFVDAATSHVISEDHGWRLLQYSGGVWFVTSSSVPNGNILVFESAASAGGGATEVLTVTGLKSTDTVLSVSQKNLGANSLPLLGWSTLADDAITGIWSIDPGAGATVLVTIKR